MRNKSGFYLVARSEHLSIPENVESIGSDAKIHNKLEQNIQICSKKRLYRNLKRYCEQYGLDLFSKVPITFHVKNA